MKLIHAMIVIFAMALLSGCALITTPVKVVGAAATTTIKTTGAVVSAPFKMAGDSDDDK